MGLLSFLKEKFKKKDKTTEQYSKGMERSRKNFSSKLKNLSERYKTVNQDYFDELEQILIESDVGINFALNIICPQPLFHWVIADSFLLSLSASSIENDSKFGM